MQIVYEKDAAKYIQTQDKPTKQRIKNAIEKLPDGDVTKLQGYTEDYRLRVGNLRVLFSMNEDKIVIKDIGPRGQIYKRL
ncbi:MAG: type II toxin-antitoxin system RelE/ParE family toxin [Lachnospiraceae bacterium]|nr:type II toxin-antitoxin system RelE/ParE family toxin [Lachnospiraceae bacterium]